VIDTLGRVEPASVQVLESSHSGFEDPAMQAVLRARFNPARLGETPVRQLTRQRISFKLTTVR
jgi:TonB family protein